MTFLGPYPVSEKVDALERSPMKAVFGLFVYLYFVYIFVYLLFFLCNGSFHDQNKGFVYGMFPSSVDFGNLKNPSNTLEGKTSRIIIDLVMLTVWACHHSLFVRGPFKRFQIETLGIPADMERSIFVLSASVMVHGMFHFWQPVDDIIWGYRFSSVYTYLGVLFG